jgi:hypothetical protein
MSLFLSMSMSVSLSMSLSVSLSSVSDHLLHIPTHALFPEDFSH